MENEKINEKILRVWDEYPKETEYWPILYPRFDKGCVLFIGINPTDSIRHVSEKLYRKNFESCFHSNSEELSRFLINIEKKANEEAPYFKKIRTLCEGTGLQYQHIDLFYFRNKNQNETKKKIGVSEEKDKRIYNLTHFAIAQLTIAIDMIEEINPKVIVVINALSSDIINKIADNEIGNISDRLKKSDNAFFGNNGYDLIEISKKKYPILFSSTISGKRPLDNHSFRRLKWQINKIINPKG